MFETSSPALRAAAGVLAVWAPVVVAFAAGLEVTVAVGFVIAAWATEWLVAYVAGRGDSADFSSQRTRPAALGSPSATNE